MVLLLKYLCNWFPVIIGHINRKIGIVDIKAIIFVSDETPMKAMRSGIVFECVKFIFYLNIDIPVFALGLTALGFNYPYRTVLFHYDIVGIEEPLMLQTVQIDDREIFAN